MASVPVAAAWQGQPHAFVSMAVVVFGLLMARRLEGVGEVIRSGVPAARAVLSRCLFDASAVPPTPAIGAAVPLGGALGVAGSLAMLAILGIVVAMLRGEAAHATERPIRMPDLTWVPR